MGIASRAVGLLAIGLASSGTPARADDGAQPARTAEAHVRADRPGGIISVGNGTQYAGLGLQLLYFQPLPLAPLGLPLAFFASGAFGNHATLDGRYTLDGEDRRLIGYSFMAGASAGRVHRACIGAGFGALAGGGVTVEGLVVGEVNDYGPFLEAGYEVLGRNGLFVRILPLGLSYLPRTRWRASGNLNYAVSLGIGWKPW